jgi:microcompartment protein CcmL/EutN
MKLTNNTSVLGVIEFAGIAVGVGALDEMVKTASIRVIEARTFYGKYLVVFSGDVASAEYSFNKGIEKGEGQIVDSLLLPGVHPEVLDAIGTIKKTEEWGTIGIIETQSFTSAIEAADIAAKTGGVSIIEINLSDGFAGKSYMKMIGSIEAVQVASEAATAAVGVKDKLFAYIIIPQPHHEIRSFFLK